MATPVHVEDHPDWCTTSIGICGDHLGAVASVPATLSPHLPHDGRAVFPSIDVAPTELADGRRGVYAALYAAVAEWDRWLGATFSPAEARRLAGALLACADLVDPVAVRWPS